jgi:hypothetical protein
MRTSVLLMSAVLLLGWMTSACRGGHTGGEENDAGMIDAGWKPDGDSGTFTDGGDDGGVEPDAGCDVAQQLGCDAGALCLRGQLDGGQGNVCFSGECDLVAQNCPAGKKCTYVHQGNTTSRRCVEDQPVGEGGTCGSETTPAGDVYDTCKAGLYCTDQAQQDGSTSFTCRRFCYGGAQCTAPQDCVEVLRFTGSAELPRVCGEPGPGCDALAQGCVTAGTVRDGTRCTYANDCLPGSACVKDGTRQVCRPLCRFPSGSPGCASGHCESLRDFANVGACLP